jgi:hypothetical protein
MKKKIYIIVALMVLYPLLVGKTAGPGLRVYFIISGNVTSISGGFVSGKKVYLDWLGSSSQSDSLLIYTQVHNVDSTVANDSGTFTFRDTSDYIYSSFYGIGLRVSADTTYSGQLLPYTGQILPIDSAKKTETLGQQNDCYGHGEPTQEWYTFPSQSITVP